MSSTAEVNEEWGSVKREKDLSQQLNLTLDSDEELTLNCMW